MESQEHRADEDVASDVMAVIHLLPRVMRGRHFHHELKSIQVSIGPKKGEVPGPGVIYKCTVSIKADSAEALGKIKGKLNKGDGWTCTDGKDGMSSECTHP